jgi:hypothetical protein
VLFIYGKQIRLENVDIILKLVKILKKRGHMIEEGINVIQGPPEYEARVLSIQLRHLASRPKYYIHSI